MHVRPHGSQQLIWGLLCSLISTCLHLQSYPCSLKMNSSVPSSHIPCFLIPCSSVSWAPNPNFPCLPVPLSLPSLFPFLVFPENRSLCSLPAKTKFFLVSFSLVINPCSLKKKSFVLILLPENITHCSFQHQKLKFLSLTC